MFKRTTLKIIQALIVVAILSFISFYLLNLMPGDPMDVSSIVNPELSKERIEKIQQSPGIDKPLTKRYAIWVKTLFTGDLGYSRTYSKSAVSIIKPRIYNSVILIFPTIIFSLLTGIVLSYFSAHSKTKITDKIICLFTSLGISAPTFWVGVILIFIFSVKFRIFPAGGSGEKETVSLIKDLKFIFLPMTTLTIFLSSYWTKYLRTAYLDILKKDFMKTAKAKGLSESQIFLKHGLRNLLIPIITLLAIYLPMIFGGTLVTETVFSWPGIGRLLYDSIMQSDFNIAMIVLLLISFATVFSSYSADIIYKFCDPRLRENR